MTSPAIALLPPERQSLPVLFVRRVWALALRHAYLYVGSWPRFVEMLYWPMINILTWGFVSLYLIQQFTSAKVIAGVFLAGVLMSEMIIRGSIGIMILFIEEIWSRNLGHLFASPLKFSDYAIGSLGLSFIRVVFAVVPAVFVAKYLFHFSLFDLGWPLLGYVPLLLASGWWYGLLILALLLRYGLAAEWLGWMGSWLLIPIFAPYYPVSVLPQWVQAISWSFPATYVFESMKSQLAGTGMRGDYLLFALGLNIFYCTVAGFILAHAYRGAQRRGGLLQVGE